MRHKLLILFAVAGLFVSASFGQSADIAPAVESRARQHQRRDSLRMLRAQQRGAALPSGIDYNKAIEQARQRREPGPPPELDASPFDGHAEDEVADQAPTGHQFRASVAFDGTTYLVVWQDASYGNISGVLVDQTGTPLDPDGFVISDYTGKSAPDYPSVAFDGTRYLVCWQDDVSGYLNIYGALVTTSGGVTNLGAISAASNNQQYPAVAFGGTNYLVVWDDGRSGAYSDIYGARVSKLGSVLDPGGFLISSGPSETNQRYASVAFDGANFLVVWEDDRDGGANIYGARVSTRGRVQDPGGLHIAHSAGDGSQYTPSVAFDGTDYLVVWSRYDANSYTYDIYGARVKPNGNLPDAGGFLIPDATNRSWAAEPVVAFDGADYIVVWVDWNDYEIYGCPVSLPCTPGAVYAISTRYDDCPAVAAGPVEGTVMVAYESLTYDPYYRIWARVGDLSLTGDVGTVSIERPVGSYLTAGSWPIPPKATVKNFGGDTDPPRSFKVTLTIPGSGYTASTKTVLGLRPGDAYARPIVFDPLTLVDGAFTATCETKLSGDGNSGNNTQTAIFQGCDFINYSDFGDSNMVAYPLDPLHWVRHAPESPWNPAPMDDVVWGYRADGTYDNSEEVTLTSPEYTANQDNPSIAFQHCFDTEADETGQDGGNFSYYADGEWHWPSVSAGLGYTGSVSELGRDGWYGTSLDWKQSVFTIGTPADPVHDGDKFKVRWTFDAGSRNIDHHGWLIDEIARIGCRLSFDDGRAPSGPGSLIDTLSVWPNPMRGDGQMSYTLYKDCEVRVNLYDITGALVRPVLTTGFTKGVHTKKMDVTRLPRGVYFLTMEGQGDSKTTKVIIQ